MRCVLWQFQHFKEEVGELAGFWRADKGLHEVGEDLGAVHGKALVPG